MGILALLPEAEKDRLPVLQAACRERSIPLVGAIFPALLAPQGFLSTGAWLLRFDSMVPAFLMADIRADGIDSADRIADAVHAALALHPGDQDRRTLFLLFDALVPNIATILDGVYLRLADRVNYAGANAGSETFQPMPCLFDNDTLVGDGVLGILVAGGVKPVLEHGIAPPELVMSATATTGNCIQSLDWRPAFEVYQEIIGQEYGISLTRENFYQYAVHYPFGILRANGEVVVRIPVAMTDSGALCCVGEVPENAMLVLLKGPEPDAGHCIDHLKAGLVEGNLSMEAREMLCFYCAGRRMHLGEAAVAELGELARQTGVSRLAGALSLGEIGSSRSWGYPLFHNAALLCAPWDGV